jgi:hypothetical protein
MTFGLQNSSGAEVFRNDFTLENGKDYVTLLSNQYVANFYSIDKPSKIVMYLFDEDKQWSERYEKNINV